MPAPIGCYVITHKGKSNFSVKTVTDGDGSGDLLVNEIGNYSGTVPVTDGPFAVSINADGRWTLKVQQ